MAYGFGALEMACSGRYKPLLVGQPGTTVDHPVNYGYTNDVDVRAWLDTMWSLKNRIRSRWNEIASKPGIQIPADVTAYVTEVENAYCTPDSDGRCTTYKLEPTHNTMLPTPETFSLNASTVNAAIQWGLRAICVLEVLDAVAQTAGQAPRPVEPAPTPVPPWIPPGLPLPGGGLGSFMWIGVAALALWLFLRRKSQQ